jgi:hypothetical protein
MPMAPTFAGRFHQGLHLLGQEVLAGAALRVFYPPRWQPCHFRWLGQNQRYIHKLHPYVKGSGGVYQKALFGRVGEASRERPLPREVHPIVIGPNGWELEAGPLGPMKDKPTCGDLCAWLSSPHTPRERRWTWAVCPGEGLRSGASRPKKRLTPVLTASDLDLSHLSRACPGLGSRLWGYAVRSVRGAFARASRASVGDRTKPPGSGILLGFLVRAGSYPVSRFVPPLRRVALSPHPPGTEVDLDRKRAINRS